MIQRTELISEECRLTSLGLQLRDAREAMGLTEQDAAARLFINVGHVRAMEEARYELMPVEVFTRGYLRAYAKLLNQDPEDILRKYRPTRLVPPPSSEPEPESATEHKQTPGANFHQLLQRIPERVLMIASGVAIVLLLVLVVSLLLPGGSDDSGADGAYQAPVAAEDNKVSDNRATSGLTANPALFKMVEDAAQLGVNLPSAGEDATSRAKSMEMKFSGDCWVEVRDSSRKILLADMRRAGDRDVLLGEPPYKVVLGKSTAATIRYQGRWIDIEADHGKLSAQLVVGG